MAEMLIRRAEGKGFLARDGASIFELFRPETSLVRNLSIAEGILEPGQQALPHYHNISEEIYYILKGRGRIRVDNGISHIRTGDAIYVPVSKVHALQNTSRRYSLKVLAISSPAYSELDIFFI